MPPLSSMQMMKRLLVNPAFVLNALKTGEIPSKTALKTAVLFWIMASLCFALTTVVQYPANWHLTASQVALRFGAIFTATLVFGIPIITTVWVALQKLSSWFWDVPISFKTTLDIAGLGIFYYALIFALAVPILLMWGQQPLAYQALLFILNISAFVLSIRLFKQAYQIFGEIPARRALFVAMFPLAIVLVVYVATQLLTYLAMHPHVK